MRRLENEEPALIDADRRARLAAAKAEITALMAPEREERRRKAKAERKAMKERIGKREAGQRQPRVKDNGYLAFLRRQPCEICKTTRHVEAAHIRSGYPEAGWRPTGMQEKPDDTRALSLCASCHREGPKAQHRSNERAWWESHGIYPPARCAELHDKYLTGS